MTFPPSPAPPPDGTEMTTDPFDRPTDATPAPWIWRALRLTVPLLFWVVLETALTVTVPTPRLMVDPLELADRAPVAARLVRSGPETTMEPLEMPAEIPPAPRTIMELSAMVPVLLWVVLPVAYRVAVAAPPAAAALRLSVSPAELLAVVPLRFVSASVGLPWLWLDEA